MKETSTIIIVAFIFLFFLYLNYRVLKRFYYFFKSFLFESINFLEKNNLKLIELKNPEKKEWNDNPFNSRNSYLLEVWLPFTLKKHKVIIASDKKNKLYKYWLLSTTPLFGKFKLEFKLDKSKNIERRIKERIFKNIKIVKNECPACKSLITSNETECPNCGLKII